MNKYSFVSLLSLVFLFSACDNTAVVDLQDKLTRTETELNDTKQMLQALHSDPKEAAAFIHNVYFWINEGVSEADLKEFEAGLRSLGEISSVDQLVVGLPAMTPREVVDNSYAYFLGVHFKDQAAHDLYQDDPIHLAFIEKSKHVWNRVQVYDSLRK